MIIRVRVDIIKLNLRYVMVIIKIDCYEFKSVKVVLKDLRWNGVM